VPLLINCFFDMKWLECVLWCYSDNYNSLSQICIQEIRDYDWRSNSHIVTTIVSFCERDFIWRSMLCQFIG